MPRISFILFIAIILSLLGGSIFLVTWDIPAPSQDMEVIIPNTRFAT